MEEGRGMTELPTIIERLDALPRGEDWRPTAAPFIHEQFADAYPELRAELLRMRDERDAARRQCKNSDKVLSDVSYALGVRKRQVDALLEALKAVLDAIDAEEGHMTLNILEQAEKAQVVIANVEGAKDGS